MTKDASGLILAAALALFASASLAAGAEPFWFGADISGAAEMDKRGEHLFGLDGKRRECTALIKEIGFNAIRLRVWVNPKDGRNSKEDVLAKALKAKALGLPVMIDFHYSDTWADPKNQAIPAAWQDHDYKTLRTDVARHTFETLKLLKKNGVKPKWVQIGNETADGFLWPVGKASDHPAQYAGLFMAGRTAAKKAFPDVAVIVHLNNGYDNSFCTWNLDLLKNNGAKWDAIGLSVYPYWAKKDKDLPHDKTLQLAAENIKALAKRYSCDVLVVETGFEVDESSSDTLAESRRLFAKLIQLCKAIPRCRGIFYWEPECRPTHYKLGAFDSKGRPTIILDPLRKPHGKKR